MLCTLCRNASSRAIIQTGDQIQAPVGEPNIDDCVSVKLATNQDDVALNGDLTRYWTLLNFRHRRNAGRRSRDVVSADC